MTEALWFFSCVVCVYVGMIIGGMAGNSKPAQPLKPVKPQKPDPDETAGDYPHLPLDARQ